MEERVRFLGEIYGEKLKECYSRSSIFLFLPKNESFSLVRTESIVSGTPVISNLSGCGEYVNGAIIVEHEEPLIISQKLKELMENRDLREKLVEEGNRTIKTWKQILIEVPIFSSILNVKDPSTHSIQ